MSEQSLQQIRQWREQYRQNNGASPLEDITQLDAQLDLTHAHPSGIAQLFASGHVQLQSLFRDSGMLKSSQHRLQRVLEDAIAVESATGYAQLSLASGIATWKDHAMPLLLYPVAVVRDTERDTLAHAQIRFIAAPSFNPAFIEAMHRNGVNIDASQLLDSSQYADNAPEVSALISKVNSIVGSAVDSFVVDRQMIVGCFMRPATLFLQESDHIIERIAQGKTGSDVLDALAGDSQAAGYLSSYPVAQYAPFDSDPHDELEIGDVDNVTRYAANIASSGASAFVDLPDARRSASVAAAIASRVVMNGRTVLYVPAVAEHKRAFTRFLKHHELNNIVVDVADPACNSTIDHQLIAAVGYQAGTASSHFDQLADELVGVRARLTKYLGDLHGKNSEWGVSAYETIQNLARISAMDTHPSTHVRLSANTARTIGNHLDEWSEKLVRAGELGEFTISPDDTAWYRASLYSDQDAIDAYQRAVRLLDTLLPTLRNQIRSVVETCGFAVPNDIQEWGRQVSVLKNLRRVLDVFQPQIFERDIQSLIRATVPKEQRKTQDGNMGFWERRRLIKEAKSMLRVGAHVEDLHEALIVVDRQAGQWRQCVPHGGWPVLPPKLNDILETNDALVADLTSLNTVLATTPQGAALETVSFMDLEQRLRALFDDHKALDTLPERSRLEREFKNQGLTELVDDLRNRHVSTQEVAGELQLSWWTTVFELIVHASAVIANQDGSVLSAASERFAQVDSEHVASVGPMISQEMTKRLSELLYSRSHEANQLHTLLAAPAPVSLGRLRRDYPKIMAATKPIMVATPAALVAGTPMMHMADVAIIDACSHMDPIELLSVLMRANQVIVLAHKETISSPAIARLTSMLHQLRLDERPVRRDVRLANFLSTHGYGPVVVPLSPVSQQTVTYTRVHTTGVPSQIAGIVDSNKAEIDVVVDAVRTRAQSFTIVPAAYLLTIVTFSHAHRHRIGAELKAVSAKEPGLRKFLRHVRIVDLDELSAATATDCIITFGFAPTSHGRLMQQFDELDAAGSDKMLLDALATASNRVDIISAFGSDDLDDDRLRQAGPQLMKQLLQWCEHLETASVPQAIAEHEDTDALLTDLADRIRARGLQVQLNYGFEHGMRIPMVVGLPDKPPVLAIVTDDNRFMAVASTRRRHRFNKDDLESLGWSVLDVWSVAAFVNPDKEVDRVVSRMARLVGDEQ